MPEVNAALLTVVINLICKPTTLSNWSDSQEPEINSGFSKVEPRTILSAAQAHLQHVKNNMTKIGTILIEARTGPPKILFSTCNVRHRRAIYRNRTSSSEAAHSRMPRPWPIMPAPAPRSSTIAGATRCRSMRSSGSSSENAKSNHGIPGRTSAETSSSILVRSFIPCASSGTPGLLSSASIDLNLRMHSSLRRISFGV